MRNGGVKKSDGTTDETEAVGNGTAGAGADVVGKGTTEGADAEGNGTGAEKFVVPE